MLSEDDMQYAVETCRSNKSFDVITSFFSGYILAVGRVRREINDVTAACPI